MMSGLRVGVVKRWDGLETLFNLPKELEKSLCPHLLAYSSLVKEEKKRG